MKNKTIISMAIATMISCPAFATGINAGAQSADCVNGTLGTYTGPASLSAQWTANTINLDFYDGETKLSSGTCTYDGGIELPEDPTKTGYEFDGWKVRRAAAAPTPVKSCSEIDNESECDAMANCYYFDDGCYEIEGVKPNCSEYATIGDCMNPSLGFSIPDIGCARRCYWQGGICELSPWECGGGSN